MKQVLIATICLLSLHSFFSCEKDGGTTGPPQTLKEISGSVKDENGNAYPNTKVTLFNPSGELETTTNSSGVFEFNLNNNGTYTITITPPLSSTLVSEDSVEVDVQVDVEKTINFIINTQSLTALVVKDSIDIFGEIRNEAGMVPSESNELIFARNVFDPPIGRLTPINDPGGDQLTLSEWGTAQGTVAANCIGNRTSVAINLQGMIPNGTYTFWLDFLNTKKTPGESLNIGTDVVKIEPLGSGTLNVAQASSNGTITANINHVGCMLTDEVALVLVVIYHINGNTFGSDHIPDEEDVSHLLVYFQ